MASIIILVTLLSALLSTASRNSPPSTNTLDVASSLRQTRSVLSLDRKSILLSSSKQSLIDQSLNSSTFSLKLLPRETLHNAGHTTYSSLLRSRLARDAARVKSIYLRLQLALEGVSNTDLKPKQESATLFPEDLSFPVVSGSSQGSGEYFGRVGVGTPPKDFFMVLDTGSDVSWLQCEPCSDCYSQADPVFNPSSSSTYRRVPCRSNQCQALEMSSCRSGQCVYQVNYGDGSFTYGDFVTETLTFTKSMAGSVSNIALGCGHDNEGLYVGSAGLLGLGGGAMSLTSQLKANSFSYCLVNRDAEASSTLDFNSAMPGDAAVAPMSRNNRMPTFFYVGLAGLGVGGKLLSIPSNIFRLDEASGDGVILDCGTAITRLHTQAYNTLRDSFVSLTPNLKRAPEVALFDTCYDLSGMASVKVPTVSFHFVGGESWMLPAANYLIPVDASGTYCFAFAPTNSRLSIIGNVQQQGTRVSFDLANKKFGFSVAKC